MAAPVLDARAVSRFILCPDPGRGSFTQTYDAEPPVEAGFGSVNAGSGRSLRVGGSGINGQFAKDLGAAGLPVEGFQRLHQDLMSSACADPEQLVEASRCPRGVAFACARVSSSDGRGFVAIDVFDEDARPLHLANAAMVYCIGPDRRECRSDEELLSSICTLGESIALACNAYMARAATADGAANLPPLQRVRVALVSGGKYAGKVPPESVAFHLLQGLAAGAGAEDEHRGPEYELAFADGCFGRALAQLRAEVGDESGSGGPGAETAK